MSCLLFARKDLARLRAQPGSLLLWLSIPLVIGAMIALATGGSGGSKPKVHLLVADADATFGSRALVTALEQSGVVRTEVVEGAAGRARIEAGDGSALLLVPAGFAAAVLRDEPTELHLVTNPAQRILPGIVEQMLRIGADAVFYLHAFAGPEIERIADGVVDRNAASAWSTAWALRGTELTERLRPLFDPLRIELVDRSEAPTAAAAATAKPATGGFGLQFWPGILLMTLFFAGQALSEDLWEERRLGTLRRSLLAPGGVRPWLCGKLLCAATVAALTGVVGLGGGALMFDLSLRAVLLGVPWMAVAGVGLLLLIWPLVCLASSARGANVLTSALMFPLLMLGGSFFPFEMMPKWMAAIGSSLPNGWLLRRLRALIAGDFEPVQLALGVAAVAALAVVIVPFCERRLVRAVAG